MNYESMAMAVKRCLCFGGHTYINRYMKNKLTRKLKIRFLYYIVYINKKSVSNNYLPFKSIFTIYQL